MLRGILFLIASTGLLCAEPEKEPAPVEPKTPAGQGGGFGPEGDRAPVEPKTLPAPDQKVAEVEPVVKKLDGDRMQVGEVILNTKTREIRFPAAVNMRDGEILEYAIVHTEGKVHESLLTTAVPATEINVAFKLLRYQGSPEFYAEWEKDGSLSSRFPVVKPEVKEAARIDIGVEWEEEGKTRTAKINEWIAHGTTGETMPADPWVYGGSMFYKGSYLAQSTGDLAAIYITNASLINFSGKDNRSDEVWFPFPKRVPAEGTKVTVVITPHKKPVQEKK